MYGNSAKKILWLTTTTLDTPGCRSTQFGVGGELVKMGWSVKLMSKSYGGGYSDAQYPNYGGKVVLIERNGRLITEIKYHMKLWKELLYNRHDVVIFEPPYLRLIFIPAILSKLGLLKTNVVLDVRSPIIDEGSESWVERVNYLAAMLFARTMIRGISAISEELVKDLSQLLGEATPVTVWGSGVDETMFDPAREEKELLSFPAGSKVFMYHGSVGVHRGVRGVDKLIMAFRRLLDDGVAASLLILAEEGPTKETLKSLVREANMEENVSILPPVGNEVIPSYIAASDFGVIPLPDDRCWQVSSPIKLFEYMAMEKPIVATDIKAHRAVLKELPGVSYAASCKEMDLYVAMKSALEKAGELTDGAKELRREVIKHHTWAVRAETLSSFLQKMCGN